MQKSLQRKTGQLFDTLNQVSVTLAQVTRMIDRITPSQGCEPCVVLLLLDLDDVNTDNAPSQVKLLSADQGKINGNTWTYTIPTLAAGESKSFAIKAKYTAYVAGTHVNKVCVDTPTIPGSLDPWRFLARRS